MKAYRYVARKNELKGIGLLAHMRKNTHTCVLCESERNILLYKTKYICRNCIEKFKTKDID